MSLIRRKPYSADVVVAEPTRYLVWDRKALDRLWRRHPTIKAVFEPMIGIDMAEKLVGERQAAAAGDELPQSGAGP